jgi:hypothetical protein
MAKRRTGFLSGKEPDSSASIPLMEFVVYADTPFNPEVEMYAK